MYLLDIMVDEIIENAHVCAELQQDKIKLKDIKRAKLSEEERAQQYFRAFGLVKPQESGSFTFFKQLAASFGLSEKVQQPSVNEYDLINFMIKKDPNVCVKLLQRMMLIPREMLGSSLGSLIPKVDELLRLAIETGNKNLVKTLITFADSRSVSLGASLLEVARKQGQEMVDLVQAKVKVGGLHLDRIFKPEVLNKIISSSETDFQLLEKNPAKFIKAFELQDFASTVIPALFEAQQNRGMNLDEKFNQEMVHAVANDFELTTSSLELKYLFDKMHPDGQIDSPLTPLDARYLAKRFGHLLGLSNHITLESDGQKHHIGFEISDIASSRINLQKMLRGYIDSPALEGKPERGYFQQIEEAITLSSDLIGDNYYQYDAGSEDIFHARYQLNKMVSIASGWGRPGSGHGVDICLHGPYLVYTNRGEAGFNHGSQIYKIKDPSKITPEYIAKLFPGPHNITSKNLHDTLSEVVDLDKPLVSFPSKGQKHSNCTFANPKSAIEPMLFLCAHSTEKGPNLEGVASVQTERNQHGYKDFSQYIRDQTIQEVIDTVKWAKTPQMQDFYVGLIKNIIEQHGGISKSEKKSVDDVLRIAKLLQNIPVEIQQKLESDSIHIEFLQGALRRAIDTGNKQVVDELLKIETVRDKVVDYGNNTPLCVAVVRNQSDIIRKLMEIPAVKTSLMSLDGLYAILQDLPPKKTAPLFSAMKKDESFAQVLQELFQSAKEDDNQKLLSQLKEAGVSENRGRQTMLFAKDSKPVEQTVTPQVDTSPKKQVVQEEPKQDTSTKTRFS